MTETKTRSALHKWILTVVPVLLMIPATCTSKSEQQNPTCIARRLPDNTFLYQLSHILCRSMSSPRWEDGDGINLAANLKFDPERVVSVTNSNITLKNCTTILLFRWQCAQFREQVNCSFDCRASAAVLQPPTVNTTQICFSEEHCVEQWIVFSAVGVISIIMLAAIVGVIVKNKCTKKSAEKTTTYNAEDEQVKLEEGLIDHRV